MDKRCSKENKCLSRKKMGTCDGCSFKHFDDIVTENEYIKKLKEAYFTHIIEKRKGTGGRIAIDAPFRSFLEKELKKEIPEISSCIKRIKSKLKVGNKNVEISLKYDGCFKLNDKYLFYELKGYGDNTNDILSTITAAQIIKEIGEYKNSLYLYIGLGTSKKEKCKGVSREIFLNEKSTSISPYVIWAENKKIIKFYGISEIEQIIEEIKSYFKD